MTRGNRPRGSLWLPFISIIKKTMYAQKKIDSLREVMVKLDSSSEQYKAYESIVAELKAIVTKEQMANIVVHKAAEPEICESCQ